MSDAWADYLDARLRLVHTWAGEGMPFAEMAARLTPEPDQLAFALLTPTQPPLPGSSRDRLTTWQQRAEQLERELHARRVSVIPAAPLVPIMSQVRALLSDPDPDRCGCQHWTDHPEPHQHHADCSQAPPPMPTLPPLPMEKP